MLGSLRGSVRFAREPSVREAAVLLERIAAALRARGVDVERGPGDEVRFRVPPPWRSRHLNPFIAVSAGTVRIAAGEGGPRRVRFVLEFRRLALYGLVIAAVVFAGIIFVRGAASRAALGALGLVLWLVVGVAPKLAAARRFRAVVRRAAGQPAAAPASPPRASGPEPRGEPE